MTSIVFSDKTSAQLILVYAGNEFEPDQTGHRFSLSSQGTIISDQPEDQDTLMKSERNYRVQIYLGDDGFWHLVNLNKRRPVYVDSLITQRHLLSTGEILQVGTAVFKFVQGSGADTDLYDTLHQRIETERKRADTDLLTKIPNRGVMERNLKSEMDWSKRYQQPLSFMMIDIDYFKKINDTYGHHGGDAVLETLAAHIQAQIRGVDTFARMGGEEFGILLRGATLDQALVFAERIRTMAEQLSIFFDHQELHVTLSIGVVAWIEGWSIKQLVAEADRLLYVAKNQGRNKVIGSSITES